MPVSVASIVPRGLLGGTLMGLANLVPGISGGTMLLAAGIYPRFIEAVARATTLRFDRTTIAVLGSVGSAAAVAIVLLAGIVKTLVVDHRWVMYSLFIGLTLGGLPVVWRLIRETGRRPGAAVWGGAAAGFLAMGVVAWMQLQGVGGGSGEGVLLFFLGGLAGAAAMILPGVSGGYLLLVLGAYVPILGGIDAFRAAVSVGDTAAVVSVGTGIILPVGAGVLAGIAGVSHLLRWLLDRYESATLGVLLGLLVGAVVGLWPFQTVRLPDPGAVIKGQAVEFVDPAVGAVAAGPEAGGRLPVVDGVLVRFVETGELVEIEDLPTRVFTPSAAQMAGALLLIFGGFAVTLGIDHMGRERRAPVDRDADP